MRLRVSFVLQLLRGESALHLQPLRPCLRLSLGPLLLLWLVRLLRPIHDRRECPRSSSACDGLSCPRNQSPNSLASRYSPLRNGALPACRIDRQSPATVLWHVRPSANRDTGSSSAWLARLPRRLDCRSPRLQRRRSRESECSHYRTF